MALLLLNLGAGALAQTDVLGMLNTAGYTAQDTSSSTCNAAAFAALDVANAVDAGDRVPILVTTTNANATSALTDLGVEDVEAFSGTVYRGFFSAAAVDATFDDATKFANQITDVTPVTAGAKLSVAIHAVQSGDANAFIKVDANTVKSQAVVHHTGAIPTLAAIAGNAVNGTNTAIFPDCLFNSQSADFAANAAEADANATAVSGTGTVFTFGNTTTLADYVLFLGLLANEPAVKFVEPVLVSETFSASAEAVLTFPQGDAKDVAQGFGVSGVCQYMHDREFDGEGEVVGVFDDGLFATSTFFFDVEEPTLGCYDNECCINSADCAAYDEDDSCDAVVGECQEVAAGNAQIYFQQPTQRKIVSLVPAVDGVPANHGTEVTSAIVGSPLQYAEFECEGELASSSDIRGVASSATAFFVDLGNAVTGGLEVPASEFGALLDLAYANGANAVTLAWGAAAGAVDSVTSAIDAFVVGNSDAVVVTAAGNKGGAATNTGIAKNAISVGVFSSEMSDLRPTLSVQLSSGIDAGTYDAEVSQEATQEGSCLGTSEFAGSSAAAAVVSGQVALTEQYLKQEGTIYEYGAGAGTTATAQAGNAYTGATIKALLVTAANDNNRGETYGNGFGVPVLDRVLPFTSEHQFDLRIEQHTLATTDAGSVRTRNIIVDDVSRPLIITLAYSDTVPTPLDAASTVVNDVRLTLLSPSGNTLTFPHKDGAAAATANAQKIIVSTPEAGNYTVNVEAKVVAVEQPVSLVVVGRFSTEGQAAGEITATPACCPWGTLYPTTSCFPISFLVLILVGVFAVILLVMCIVRAKLRVKDVEAPN